MAKVTDEERTAFYKSASWRRTRRSILERDNYECQRCKELGLIHLDSVKQDGERKSIELNVHHKQPLEDHPELAYDPDNLVTLCLFHHNEVEGRLDIFRNLNKNRRKRNKWSDDEKW